MLMSMRARYKDSWVSKILIAGVVLVLLLQGVLLLIQVFGQPYDPLGDYPPQDVSNIEGDSGYPVVLPGDPLTVIGTKCNTTDKVLGTVGSVRWTTIEPLGTSIETSSNAPGERPPGCVENTFSNPVPAEVLARNQKLYDSGSGSVIWVFRGYEQPVASDGTLGVGRSWETEPFIIEP